MTAPYPTKGEIETLLAEARLTAQEPTHQSPHTTRLLNRLADALALTRGGVDEIARIIDPTGWSDERFVTLDEVEAANYKARKRDEAFTKARAILALSAGGPSPSTFQTRVTPWMDVCFGPEISGDKVERGDRLLEEVFELLQAGGYDPGRVVSLRDYVWDRPVGEPSQEVGGVMVTLAALCLAYGLDMHESGETELARIWTKVEAIRAKQAAKPKHSPLPITQPVKILPDTEHDGGEVFDRWLPIETAPIDGMAVLGFGNRATWCGGYSIQSATDFDKYLWEGVSHWMPLPPPPRTGGE